MVKKVAFCSGSLITIILIILAIIGAIFYKGYIGSSFNQEQNVSINSVETSDGVDANLDRAHSSIMNQIIARKEFRIGMLRTLTTLYIDYSNPNQLGGFESALLKKFADSLNVKLKISYANSLAELVEKSKDGKIDLIATEMVGNKNYINLFIASQPFYYNTQQMVYRKGSAKPYSFNDITGDLTVPKDSLQSNILTQTQTLFSELNWNESAILNQEGLLRLVENQDIDYTIASNHTIAIMQRIYPLLTVAFDVAKDYPKSWYLAKSTDLSLLTKLNQFIQKSHDDGTIKKLEYHYFNYMNKFDYVDIRAFIRSIETKLPKYQPFFEEYSKINNLDWKLVAAMAYQESHWNPKAVSSTGVRGIMMLTKSTAESLGITNRLDAKQNIKGGTIYLKQIVNRMPQSISKEERVWFALAAYNMGTAHLWDARKLAIKLDKNPDSWQDIRQILPLLSEEEYYTDLKYGYARGYQAVHFVDSIQQYYISLVGFLLEKEYQKKYIIVQNDSGTPK